MEPCWIKNSSSFIPGSAPQLTLLLSLDSYAVELVPPCLPIDLLSKSTVNPPHVQEATDPAWTPLDVSQKCENKMALDLLTHWAECDCRRVGGGVGVGVGFRPLSLFLPIAIVPPLWPGACWEGVEEVYRQLELRRGWGVTTSSGGS